VTAESSADEIRRQMAAQYDEVAEGYEKLQFVRLTAARLVELAAPQPGERVLDAGTGTGHAALAAAKTVGPEGAVVGIDISPGMLTHARRKADELGLLNVEFREGDAQNPSFPSAAFDAILSASVIWYLPSPAEAVRNWKRLLKPGGRMIFSTFGPENNVPLAGLFDNHLAAFGLKNPRGIHSIRDAETCKSLLVEAGVQDPTVHTERWGYFFRTLDEFWDEVRNTNARVALRTLAPHHLEQLRDDLLREVAPLQSENGLWRPLEVNYCMGRAL
jgi:ubiquinone/menaquinone biosynthesis C-methylase UbiE